MTTYESGKKKETVQVDIDMKGELPRILRLTLERHRRETEEDKEVGRGMRTRRAVEVVVAVVSLLQLVTLLLSLLRLLLLSAWNVVVFSLVDGCTWTFTAVRVAR